MFMNDLDAGVECTISKFADDTKLGPSPSPSSVDSLEGQEALQRDLEQLEHWEMINGTKFNKSKCQILHLGQSNAGHRYKFGEEWLENSLAEKDLVVLDGSRLHRSQPHVLAAQRTNHTLGCVRHNTTSRSEEGIVLLCSALVWAHLELCVHFWVPQFEKDVKVLECIQRRSRKLMRGWKARPVRSG